MLTVRAFSSSGAANKYYSHGDYYGTEGQGIWLGEGAKELGLKGEFTASSDKPFNNLLSGILPSGQVLGRKTKDGIEHRPGIDLTFSCPKSFSIEMLVFANKEQKQNMETAMMKAVTKTLGYIEKQGYVIARKGKAGHEKEPINKLAFASFFHTTNRNLEPQAHVHCFLANAGKCEDGKYRSLAFDKILENNKFFGQIFRNELALEAKKLGYNLSTKILSDGSSSFELSNIDNKLIDAFSTRRQEIEALCKLYGVTTKEGRDKIVINSRKTKQKIKEEDLHKTWNNLADNIQKEIKATESSEDNLKIETQPRLDAEPKSKPSLSVFNRIGGFFTKGTKDINVEVSSEDNLVQDSVLSLKELTLLCVEDVNANKSVFSQEELLKTTLKYSIGNHSVDQIHEELTRLEKDGLLIRNGNFLTSRNLLNQEKQILKFAQGSLDTSKAIVETKYFDKHYSKFEKREIAKNNQFQVNDQQKKALKHILTAKDKIIAMEGLPGVGKSTVLNAVRDISRRKIINLIGLGEKYQGAAPTTSAAKTLEQSAKVESSTLHSFLGKYQGYIQGRGNNSLSAMRQEFKQAVIFVDEASLISTKTMHQLLTLQAKLGFKLVLTGDTKQLGSVEAGKSFEQMLQVLPCVKLNKIVRQKDEAHKEAVIASSEGMIRKSFEIHHNNIVEAKDDNAIAQESVSMFMSKNQAIQDKTLLISPTRALRDDINNKIIQSLRATNQIQGNIIKFTALRQKDMTKADYGFSPSFSAGDVLKFNKSYKNGIEKGDYLKVKKVNEITNSLVLEKDKKEFLYQLKKDVDHQSKFEVFRDHSLDLQAGLKIIFTKNDKQNGLVNSETAIIENISKSEVTLKLEDGKVKTIAISDLKHIDHGYCVTIHTSQGKTFDNTIAAISDNKLLNNQKSWLVAISRHRNEMVAIVSDKSQLEAQITRNKAIETSAIELVAQKEAIIDSQNDSKSLLKSQQNDIVKALKQVEVEI